MWFNILPAVVIITGSFVLPGFGTWWAYYYFTGGNHFRRTMIDRWDRRCYQRDGRLTNDPYKVVALDAIPDKEKKEL